MTGPHPSNLPGEGPHQTFSVWRGLERGLGLACAAVLTIMMLLTGADVLARYVFNAPIKGAFELTEILLVCFVFSAMPLAMLANAHIEVELWEPKTALGDIIRLIVSGAAALMVFGGLAWQLFDHAQRLKSYGSVSNSLEIPLYIIAFIAMVGCILGAVVALYKFVSRIAEPKS